MYLHELQERKQTGPANTAWPEMSTDDRDYRAVQTYLAYRSLSFELAEDNGWYPSRNAQDYWLRVVIPAQTRERSHVYWQARAVSPEAKIRYQSPSGPRLDAIIQVNPSGGIEPVSVITEGPMDALAAAMCGYRAFALMGITPPGSTLDFLKTKLHGRPALIVFDNEAYAKTQGIRTCVELASRGIRARPCPVDGAKDLAAMSIDKRRSFLDTLTVRLHGKTKKDS